MQHMLKGLLSFKSLHVWFAAAVLTVTLLPVSVFVGTAEGAEAQMEVASQAGNAEVGRKIFTGGQRLTNGGPPCISCHNAGSVGGGASTLGPSLTNVYRDKPFLLDPNWINSEGVPVMGAIFPRKNITPEEVENLKAFFSTTVDQPPTVTTSKFLGTGIIGTIIALIIFSIIWSGRYRKRCQGTAHDALWRNYGGKGGR